jgi:hypothetical protein
MLDMMPPDGPRDVPLSLGGKSGGFEKKALDRFVCS